MSPLAGEADNKGFLGEILFARQKNRLFIGPTPSGGKIFNPQSGLSAGHRCNRQTPISIR